METCGVTVCLFFISFGQILALDLKGLKTHVLKVDSNIPPFFEPKLSDQDYAALFIRKEIKNNSKESHNETSTHINASTNLPIINNTTTLINKHLKNTTVALNTTKEFVKDTKTSTEHNVYSETESSTESEKDPLHLIKNNKEIFHNIIRVFNLPKLRSNISKRQIGEEKLELDIKVGDQETTELTPSLDNREEASKHNKYLVKNGEAENASLKLQDLAPKLFKNSVKNFEGLVSNNLKFLIKNLQEKSDIKSLEKENLKNSNFTSHNENTTSWTSEESSEDPINESQEEDYDSESNESSESEETTQQDTFSTIWTPSFENRTDFPIIRQTMKYVLKGEKEQTALQENQEAVLDTTKNSDEIENVTYTPKDLIKESISTLKFNGTNVTPSLDRTTKYKVEATLNITTENSPQNLDNITESSIHQTPKYLPNTHKHPKIEGNDTKVTPSHDKSTKYKIETPPDLTTENSTQNLNDITESSIHQTPKYLPKTHKHPKIVANGTTDEKITDVSQESNFFKKLRSNHKINEQKPHSALWLQNFDESEKDTENMLPKHLFKRSVENTTSTTLKTSTSKDNHNSSPATPTVPPKNITNPSNNSINNPKNPSPKSVETKSSNIFNPKFWQDLAGLMAGNVQVGVHGDLSNEASGNLETKGSFGLTIDGHDISLGGKLGASGTLGQGLASSGSMGVGGKMAVKPTWNYVAYNGPTASKNNSTNGGNVITLLQGLLRPFKIRGNSQNWNQMVAPFQIFLSKTKK